MQNSNMCFCNVHTILKSSRFVTDWCIYSEAVPGFDYEAVRTYTLNYECTDGIASVYGHIYLNLLKNDPPVINNLPGEKFSLYIISWNNSMVESCIVY
jgi:hypothetical protein